MSHVEKFGCLRCGKVGIRQVPTYSETSMDGIEWQHYRCNCIHCGDESHHATVVSFENLKINLDPRK